MKKVLIMMSTYNGGNKILKQVESILKQKNVSVAIYIRDDGSDHTTRKILEELSENENIIIKFGENLGWKQSFMDLVYTSETCYDYYGFSDQDDIWKDNKLIKLINMMENDEEDILKLAHCNSLSVDQNMKTRGEQELRTPCPPNFKSAIATEYFQGCGMVWNRKTMMKLKQYKPENPDLAHDYWVGLIAFLFGKIYFCDEPLFYHIRYDENSSEDGNVWKGRAKRLRLLLSGEKAYMNPVKDLLCGFSTDLQNNRTFYEDVLNYQNSLAIRFKLFFDREFRKPSALANILFKISILGGKF